MRNTSPRPGPIEHARRQSGEDRAVGRSEPGPGDVSFQDEDLVAESQDLGVAFVAGGEQPAEPRHDQPDEGGKVLHGSTTVAVREKGQNPNGPGLR